MTFKNTKKRPLGDKIMATIKSITSHDINGETELSKFLMAKQALFQEHTHEDLAPLDTVNELRNDHETLKLDHETLKEAHDKLKEDHDSLAIKHEDLDARYYTLLNDFNQVKNKVIVLQKYIMTQLDSTREMLTKIDTQDDSGKIKEDK